jgi:hypothetical protein
MRWILTLAILSLAGGTLLAQDIPSGWKVVKDAQGLCQLTVPSNWRPDKVVAGQIDSPDRKLNAIPNGATGQSFVNLTSMAKQTMPPLRVIEDSGSRLWFTYAGSNPAGGANWYVAIDGDPVCRAQITYKEPVLEETARKIALSLTRAK